MRHECQAGAGSEAPRLVGACGNSKCLAGADPEAPLPEGADGV